MELGYILGEGFHKTLYNIMTREEEIKKASVHHLHQYDYSYEEGEHLDFYIKGFTEGAKWADGHPKNVWHPACEEPKYGEIILVQIINTLSEDDEVTYYVGYSEKWLVNSMKTDGFICRWTYIKDLLPKGEEK